MQVTRQQNDGVPIGKAGGLQLGTWGGEVVVHRDQGSAAAHPHPALLCSPVRLCVRSGWASSVSVYNRLLETRPDLVEVGGWAGAWVDLELCW